MVGIKIFECALCKREVETGVKNSKRFYGTRKDVRKHLREIHHVNRQQGTPPHKGNRYRVDKSAIKDNVRDERSVVTRNCILFKEY